jgi:hypothetical protein
MSIKNHVTKKRVGVVIIALLLPFVIYQTYVFIKNLPRAVFAYEGAKLGESKDQVFYALGAPSEVLYEPKDPNSSNIYDRFSLVATKQQIDKTPLGEKGFNEWQYYRKDKPRIDIKFDKDGKVNSIGCYVPSSNDWAFQNSCLVNGIQSLDSEELIIEKLGKPDKESIDGIIKTMDYKKYNMKIFLEKKYVYYIIVTNNLSK